MQALLATSFAENADAFNPGDTFEDLSDTPSLKAALASPEKDRWVTAIRSELDNIKAEDVYDLVDPKNEQIDNLHGNKIVLRRKQGASSNVERYKAHFMAQGDHQCESIDFKETFTPIVKSASLHVFFTLCARLCYNICHMDITSVFLNGTLNKTVYMRQPKGFEAHGKEGWVWKLKKALYGLKQGGREWYHCIDKFLTNSLGLT